MKKLAILAFGLAAFGAAGTASAMDVEVKFAPRIANNLSGIDRIEGKREAFFREHRVEGPNRRRVRNLNTSVFIDTEFGNERLIPEMEDFSFANLVEAMAEHSLSQVEGRDESQTLLVEIDNFWTSNYSLNKFNSFNTRMVGTVSLLDENGNTVASEKIDTVLVPQFTADFNYTGPEYAYLRQSANVRVAPVLATFLKKGIERLYPGSDVPGPIFIRQ